MTKVQQKIGLKALMSQYCEQKGLSRADFAVRSGVSGSTVSAIDNEQWDKVSSAMVARLESFIKNDSPESVYNTADFDSVMRLCDAACAHRLMIGLIGDTGTGKTTALKAYSCRPNVFRVTFEKSMNPRQFFKSLLRELGIDFEGNVNAMIARAAHEINMKERPLLIIDEAGKITHPVMLYLHDLREKTQSNCGVVLAGMPYFRDNLQKNAGRGKEGYSGFLRRINLWHRLEGLSASEVMYIAREQGVSDERRLKEMSSKRRFGDLMNEILLDKVLKNDI